MVDIDVHSEEYILGQNIRKYRLKKGWSQKTLSDVVDIDRADISKYENGVKGEMGFKTLKKFAIALGVSADDLLIGEGISVATVSCVAAVRNRYTFSIFMLCRQRCGKFAT